jgi:Cu(I)/Ag(I) efflux system membrane fusion protein
MPEQFILRDGMQLSLALNVGVQVTSLVVPSEAILRDGLHAFVFVQKADGYLDRRRVTTGRSDGQRIEVREGVSPGDQVIVAGGRELQTAFSSLR